MKLILALMAAVMVSVGAQAQTNAVGGVANLLTNTPSGGWFASAGSYLSSSNPNLPVHGQFELGLGMAYQSGVNIGADLNIRWKPTFADLSTNYGVGFESVTRNAGIAGTVVSEMVGPFIYYQPTSLPDAEVSAGIDGGYSLLDRGAACTGYIQVLKMATPNTYLAARIAIEEDAGLVSPAPVLTAYTGVTF